MHRSSRAKLCGHIHGNVCREYRAAEYDECPRRKGEGCSGDKAVQVGCKQGKTCDAGLNT